MTSGGAKESPPKRGDIYWVDFDPARGSEQGGRRPACVVSMESFNRRMPVVVVAAMTTKIKPGLRVVVTLPAGKPMTKAGQILAFQLLTLDKSRLERRVASLTASQIKELEDALRLCWGL